MQLIQIKEYDLYNNSPIKFNQLDPFCIERLNRITRATNADIVISGGWNLYFYDDEFHILKRHIKECGVQGNIIGYINYNICVDKIEEIDAWIKDNNINSFIILDYWKDMRHLEKFSIKTDYDFGIEDYHVEQAVRILKNGNI
jgi:hypothetical protein